MKALVIGATGATGKILVEKLLDDVRYTDVVTLVRRTGKITHPKLTEIITNFEHPEDIATTIQGDVLFSCLGTTLKDAGSKDKQWHIDYEIPVAISRIAKTNGFKSMVLLSAYGASAESKVFYSNMKGKLEDTIESLSFEQYIVFRPGLLLRENTDRIGERISASVLRFINKLGLFNRFRPMPTTVLAEKLSIAPFKSGIGIHHIDLNKIFDF